MVTVVDKRISSMLIDKSTFDGVFTNLINVRSFGVFEAVCAETSRYLRKKYSKTNFNLSEYSCCQNSWQRTLENISEHDRGETVVAALARCNVRNLP